ncbi:uncharacterized protein NPIL_30921 [Nephila pilipes]|uniref:Uncharacterized protein n=1 Tax=Nephila pilipes TaxID=299642 RepID=A0A8X6M798_NEPPI|nr:uncharacterized protein NPIL_30921 [Nephila pilipes]
MNCNFLASIDWMRYQDEWIPRCLVMVNTYSGEQLEVRPQPESLQCFSFRDVVRNLKWSPYSFNEEDGYGRSEIVWVPENEFEAYLAGPFCKEYLEKQEEQGWEVVIGATDLATFMYLDRLLPRVVEYVGPETQRAETVVHEVAQHYRWREDHEVHV